MEMGFTITGISNVGENMSAVGTAVEEAKNAAVLAVAQQIASYAQAFAQGGHPNNPESVTGDLVDSISAETSADGEAVVYTTSEYAPYVEYGHAQNPGQYVPDIGAQLVAPYVDPYPFFQPAIDQVIDGGEAQQIFEEYLSNAVNEADGGGGTAENEPDFEVPQDVEEVVDL